MKILTLIFSFFLLPFSNGTEIAEINKEVTVNGLTYLYGEINREGLNTGTYQNWFQSNYARYQPDTKKLSTLNEAALEGITIKLLMGTWCGDSKRNVPIFYKIMDQTAFNEENLTVWALDRRKQGPNNEHIQYGIRRVPTIIFYRDDVEIGRFIERLKPGQKMEDVILDVLNR